MRDTNYNAHKCLAEILTMEFQRPTHMALWGKEREIIKSLLVRTPWRMMFEMFVFLNGQLRFDRSELTLWENHDTRA